MDDEKDNKEPRREGRQRHQARHTQALFIRRENQDRSGWPAIEELIAELGATFLCADLGITLEPRQDQACYIKNWLVVLKNDKKAVFTAAATVSQAATWLLARETIAT